MKIFAHTHTHTHTKKRKEREPHYYLCIESLTKERIPKNRKNQKNSKFFVNMSKSKGDEEENSWDPYKADKELGKQMDIARDIFL